MAEYSIPSPFNISNGLITGCPICNTQDNLSRCAACKVVSYCNRLHQVADRPAHKAFCTKIKKAQARLDFEEAKLRAHPGDFLMPANPFETCVGLFWGISDTRDYMQARFAVVDAQMKVNTESAVNKALDHILDMLRLCRGDNMGVRDIAPALLLRLSRDQECYDFVKWWGTTGREGNYDWGNTELPYMDTKDADVFEDVTIFTGEWPVLSHLLAVILLKIRLLIDLQMLERTKREVGPHVPAEILNVIRGYTVSSITTAKRSILECEDHGPQIKELEKQVKLLYDTIKRENRYLWPAMLKPGNHLTSRPSLFSPGSVQEMQLKLQYFYNAWAETPGAMGVIEALGSEG